jgi:type IV pilus assembly protein PilV
MNKNLKKVDCCRERVLCGANNHGFTLLEVLIALLVLMAAMLGLAGLQTMSLSTNHSAYLRSQAIIQAHDMADRMHANSAGVKAGAYSSISGLGGSPPICLTTATTGGALSGVDCNPAQIAQFDGNEWNTSNANELPSGAGTVAGPDGNGVYAVTLSWVEDEKSGADLKTFVFQVKPLP